MSKRKFDIIWLSVTFLFVLIIAGPFYASDKVIILAYGITVVISMFSFSLYKGMLRKMVFYEPSDNEDDAD